MDSFELFLKNKESFQTGSSKGCMEKINRLMFTFCNFCPKVVETHLKSTVNIYTVDLPVDLRWTTTNKARAKGLHGAALENYLINWSCDVGEGLEMAWLFESKRVYEHLKRKNPSLPLWIYTKHGKKSLLTDLCHFSTKLSLTQIMRFEPGS